MKQKYAYEKPREYTSQEINEIAEWLNDLTLEQIFFLKKSYEAFVAMETINMESPYVH